ncbi:MAG: hypothetical protein MZV63_39125 [Marinilabiliales bacterium]|nr:hypothetical protein [Marinilabiliales bacterium]
MWASSSRWRRRPIDGTPHEESRRSDRCLASHRTRERQRLLFNDNVTQGELFEEWKSLQASAVRRHRGWRLVEDESAACRIRSCCRTWFTGMPHAVIFTAQYTPKVIMDVFEVKKVERRSLERQGTGW